MLHYLRLLSTWLVIFALALQAPAQAMFVTQGAASSTSSGNVTTGTQTFAGDKTFSGTTTLGTTNITALILSSTLTASGTATFNNNVTIGGTLGVTGASTLTGTTTFTAAPTIGNTYGLGGRLTSTGLSGDRIALAGECVASPASSSSGIYYGGNFRSEVAAANAQNLTSAVGLRGVSSIVSHAGSGTVTGAAALLANTITKTGGGIVTTAYGLYVAAQSAGTANWGVYDLSSQSYHAGNLGIGMTPSRKLDVTGTFGATGAATLGSTLAVTGASTLTGGATMGAPLTLKSYTVATLPSAATAGQMIYVSDAAGGAVMAFSNGTNWLRCDTSAVIS